jgi:hypothetical protein
MRLAKLERNGFCRRVKEMSHEFEIVKCQSIDG